MTSGKVIIFSAPSGSGKSTIVNALIERMPCLEFSISATSRAPRGNEQSGVEYYFMSHADFMAAVAADKFVEWEEVYPGTCYGTLRSELQRIWAKGNTIVFDVDVKGGLNIKSLFGDNALSVFIMPPSVEELEKRLTGRATDSPETIRKRIDKAETEISFAPKFDAVVINDNLQDAISQAEKTICEFLEK